MITGEPGWTVPMDTPAEEKKAEASMKLNGAPPVRFTLPVSCKPLFIVSEARISRAEPVTEMVILNSTVWLGAAVTSFGSKPPPVLTFFTSLVIVKSPVGGGGVVTLTLTCAASLFTVPAALAACPVLVKTELLAAEELTVARYVIATGAFGCTVQMD